MDSLDNVDMIIPAGDAQDAASGQQGPGAERTWDHCLRKRASLYLGARCAVRTIQVSHPVQGDMAMQLDADLELKPFVCLESFWRADIIP